MKTRVALAATATLALVALSACAQQTPVELAASPTPSPSPAEVALSERYVEPPVSESGVVVWPDYGDFYLEGNKAVKAVTFLRLDGRDADADLLMRIAGVPQARWMGDFMGGNRLAIQAESSYREAARAERIALLAMVHIPGRHCDPIEDPEAAKEHYRERMSTAAAPKANFDVEVWYVLEPGALTGLGECVDADLTIELLQIGIEVFVDAGIEVFVDAGSVTGLPAADMAERLALLDLSEVSGIAIGSSSYQPEDAERERGDAILEALGQDHLTYILDTSRNGGDNPPPPGACNPEGQAIGKAPRLMDDGNLRAYVWIMRPGESDDSGCRGGVVGGEFSTLLGLELAGNADPANA